jgi:trk system potassium uptake protein
MLIPFAVSWWYRDGESVSFLLTFVITLGLGLLLWLPLHHRRVELRARDAFIIAALFWIVLGLLSAMPFVIGPHLGYTDSVFEAVSAFTNTGATIIVGLDGLPRSILYYRQQLQFLGGMGAIVLAVAVLPLLGVGGMQLYRAETRVR